MTKFMAHSFWQATPRRSAFSTLNSVRCWKLNFPCGWAASLILYQRLQRSFFVLGRSWILYALCKAVILHSDLWVKGKKKKKKKSPRTHLDHKALLMELYWLLKITIIVTMPLYYCLISGTDFGVILVAGLILELQ